MATAVGRGSSIGVKTVTTAKKTASSSRVKANTSPASAERRRKIFVERYLVNGNNATDAAKFAGFSEQTAYKQGSVLLRHPDVIARLGNRVNEVLEEAILSTDRWAKEMAAIGHLDPGEFYDDSGALIPIKKLPEHVRRAIGSIEHATEVDKEGNTTHYTKIKPNDKNTALANIGRHLGMFEKDNQQNNRPIQIAIQILD